MVSNHQILVVGAGPTGLTLACELFRLGVGCRIVDASLPTGTGSRAIGVSARSLEILDEFDAAAELVELGVRSTKAAFYSGRSRLAEVSAAAVRDTRFPFMLTVPQPDTVRVLEQRLRSLGGEVERPVVVRDLAPDAGGESVSVVLEHADGTTENASASWVVGADGAHSVVRKRSGIGFEGAAAKDTFIIVDVLADGGPPAGEGHYYFHPDGMSLVTRLPDGSYRLAATADAGTDVRGLSLADVQDLFERRIDTGIRIRTLRDAGWGVATTQVRTRMATTFRAGRCVIAGDAAHLFGPVGGQGMNGGIQDAHNLAWKLALVCLDAAGEELIDTYEAERLPAAKVAMSAASGQTRLGTLRPWLARTARDLLLRLGGRTGKLTERLVPTLTQLGTTYPASPLFGLSHGSVRGAGQRIADTPVRGVPDAGTLFDLLRRRWFTVLVLGAGPADEQAVRTLAGSLAGPGDAPLTAPLTAQVVAIDRESTGGQDVGDRLHQTLSVSGPSAYLVRPDGFIAACTTLGDTTPITSTLARIAGGSRAAAAVPSESRGNLP
jgi:2-polyprenyl-6-methoxyphenol hydroxylase-like FAD-dependent oxidoreductase